MTIFLIHLIKTYIKNLQYVFFLQIILLLQLSIYILFVAYSKTKFKKIKKKIELTFFVQSVFSI